MSCRVQKSISNKIYMDISIFLAQVFGLYFIFAGIALLIRKDSMTLLLNSLSSSGFMYMSGFITLTVGIPLILIHNVWDGSWRVIITVLVWVTLIKGLVLIFAPEFMANTATKLTKHSLLFRHGMWVVIIFGLYLVYIGFDLSQLS